jgi:hypothetical protein
MVRRTDAATPTEYPIALSNRNLDFDFDRWAAEVRQQMLEALRKRNNSSDEMR